MNFQQTELPRIKRDNNVLTDRVLLCMERAEQCVKWLKAQGFTVLGVRVGRRNPRIDIQSSGLCMRLEGAVYITERKNLGIKRGWVAIRHGCEVRWTTEIGGAA